LWHQLNQGKYKIQAELRPSLVLIKENLNFKFQPTLSRGKAYKSAALWSFFQIPQGTTENPSAIGYYMHHTRRKHL
jgi:hypothetical protein